MHVWRRVESFLFVCLIHHTADQKFAATTAFWTRQQRLPLDVAEANHADPEILEWLSNPGS